MWGCKPAPDSSLTSNERDDLLRSATGGALAAELFSDLPQRRQQLLPLRSRIPQPANLRRDPLRRHAVLDQLWDSRPAEEEIHQRDVSDLEQRSTNQVRHRSGAVYDDQGAFH